MPSKPVPVLYSLAKTHFWFAVTSILLLGSLVWTVAADYNREWKGWQRKFIALKTEKIRAELKAAEAKIDLEALQALEAKLEERRAEFKKHKSETSALKKEISRFELGIARIKADAEDRKQYIDSYTYSYEQNSARGDARTAGEYQKKIRELETFYSSAKVRLEKLEAEKEKAVQRRAAFSLGMKSAQREIDEVVKEKARIKRRLDLVRPTLAKEILNAPMIDFIAPSLRIQQVVVENLYDDYHFSRVQKVDRCTTCHLGIDQAGFEAAPQPFRTHPKLDLFVGSKSPHALESFGCTVCHGGNGHSVSFRDSAHEPSDAAELAAWTKRYGWKRLDKWDAKMLPTAMTEASCAKCHHGTLEVPQAPRLNEGRRLARKVGCFNCHTVKGFEDAWKVGPDLRNAGSKINEEWMIRWLQDPNAFRPGARMPRVFHLSNSSDASDHERGIAAIEASAAYILKHSDATPPAPPPVPGDAVRGGELFKQVGCLGCHSGAGITGGTAGPELIGLGSKVSASWLYAWLKDPKRHSPETRMPDQRLTNEEAADIAAYLLTSRADAFDALPAPRAKPEVLDEMVSKHLVKNMRVLEAVDQLKGMDRGTKLEFLGKRTIAHQGCFGCHAIQGFEDAKPIGSELTEEASKDIHKFDFGRAPIEYTRQAWVMAKLKDPRIFDEGRVRDYLEKLRMPNFGFTDDEILSLTTFVMSLSGEYVPLEMQKIPGERGLAVEKGRNLIAKHSCQACHTLDSKEGVLRKLTADPGDAPPILDGEGIKVQERWLHEFLKAPAKLRPWLKSRMPNFGLNDEELETLVRYFSALEKIDASYRSYTPLPASPEHLEAGQILFTQFQCVKCHQMNAQSVALGVSSLGPDMNLTRERLKPDWVDKWLEDPQVLQAGTMMPTYFPEGQTPLPNILGGDAKEQARAIRDHLYHPGEGGIINASPDNPQKTLKGEKK